MKQPNINSMHFSYVDIKVTLTKIKIKDHHAHQKLKYEYGTNNKETLKRETRRSSNVFKMLIRKFRNSLGSPMPLQRTWFPRFSFNFPKAKKIRLARLGLASCIMSIYAGHSRANNAKIKKWNGCNVQVLCLDSEKKRIRSQRSIKTVGGGKKRLFKCKDFLMDESWCV